MRHIMLDLETVSNRYDAGIASIGAIRFDPNTQQLGESFYMVLERSSMKLGHVDVDTMLWWAQQEREALRVLYDDSLSRVNLSVALLSFTVFCKSVPESIVWGNGSTFDNVILHNAYDDMGLECPIGRKLDYCYRTVRRMFPMEEEARQGVYHNALDDARHQARHLMKVLRKINWEKEPK